MVKRPSSVIVNCCVEWEIKGIKLGSFAPECAHVRHGQVIIFEGAVVFYEERYINFDSIT